MMSTARNTCIMACIRCFPVPDIVYFEVHAAARNTIIEVLPAEVHDGSSAVVCDHIL